MTTMTDDRTDDVEEEEHDGHGGVRDDGEKRLKTMMIMNQKK
jgi:hypothetical protein